MNKVSAILTADWHLRDSVPICRTDNFFDTQWGKVSYICDLQEKYDCPVLHSGDLFHFWKPSPYLLSHAIMLMPRDFHTVYGNHDLPAHRLEERNRSGVHTLEMAGKVNVIIDGSWGTELRDDMDCVVLDSGKKIFIWHKFVWMNEKPYPQAREEDRVENIMELPQLKEFDVVLTGDHHSAFSYTHDDGRILVNAGQITRQVANAKPPCVWLYNEEEHKVEQHFIPFEPDHVTRQHLDIKKDKLNKLDAFIEGLSEQYDLSETFEHNLRLYIDINEISQDVSNLVWWAMERQNETK